MITVRDIPKPLRDLLLVDSLEPVSHSLIDKPLITRIAYSISAVEQGLKVSFHKDSLLQGEAEQLLTDYFIAKRQANL